MQPEKLDPREEHHWVPGPHPGMNLFARRLAAANGASNGTVLYVHGATFPSALSIAQRFDGRSWRDELCDAGFDAWGFDFHGFGHSDRYREMSAPPDANPPLCRAGDAAAQVEAVVRFIAEHTGRPHVSLIAHSWGSMPACRCAVQQPSLIDRIVLFGPISRRAPQNGAAPPPVPAWRVVTLEAQWARFIEDVPPHEPPVLSKIHFEDWGKRYLDTDPHSRGRAPAGVQTPAGPSFDIQRAWQGDLAYDPAAVRAPVAIIRGEWDGLIPDADARWLFDAFSTAPAKRDIKISRATHLMHLETMRHALHHESIAFLQSKH
jgi:pimeloyl-ACP methyl ester carboxylesterase